MQQSLLRPVSGSTWGCLWQNLLHLYKVLIRYRLDYGCQFYDSASKTIKRKLDVIHHKAFCVCFEALFIVLINAFKVELGETLRQLRGLF